MSALILKILNGPHAGAEAALEPGRYVIGRGDSCDLILSDAAMVEEHAVLEIDRAGATLRPAGDGEVRLEGKILNAAHPMPAFAVATLGTTQLALGPEGDTWPRLSLPDLVDREPQESAEPAQTPKKGDTPQAEPAQAEEPEANQDLPHSKTRHPQPWILVSAALLILGALAIWLLLKPHSNQPRHHTTPVEQARLVLAEMNLEHLEISRLDDGRLKITGYVSDENQRQSLTKKLQTAGPRFLNQTMARDRVLHACEEFFHVHDLHPHLELDPKGCLRLSGVLPSTGALNHLLERLRRDVPVIRDIDNQTMSLGEVQSVLEKLMQKTGVSLPIRAKLENNTLTFQGVIPSDAEAAWRAIQENMTRDLPSLHWKDQVVLGQQANPDPGTSPSGEVSRPPLRLEVASISVGNLRYLTLADGAKIFEGARLRSGYRVLEISADRLILEFGGNPMIVPLQGP